jgi:hypothetical protein
MRLYSGEAIVGSLDSTTEIAEHILDSETKNFQLNGLANNIYEVKVQPNSNGRIILRNDTLNCLLISDHRDAHNRRLRGIPRGNPMKLWDVTNQTYKWPFGDYWLRYYLHVDWDNMESAIQKTIMESAARRYQILMLGDQATDQYLAEMEARALFQANTQDAESRQTNVFQQLTPTWKVALDPGNTTNLYGRGRRRWR